MKNEIMYEKSQTEFDRAYPIGYVLIEDPKRVTERFRSDIIQAKWEKDEIYGCWVRVA